MISAKYRFHGHGSLRYLFKNARSVRSRYFAVRVISNPRRKQPRLAVIVSKKVHKSAVGRNRIRRRLYEILRQEAPRFSGVFDIALIVINGEVLNAEYGELRQVVRDLLRQSDVY